LDFSFETLGWDSLRTLSNYKITDNRRAKLLAKTQNTILTKAAHLN
jgi:hypothetical protein